MESCRNPAESRKHEKLEPGSCELDRLTEHELTHLQLRRIHDVMCLYTMNCYWPRKKIRSSHANIANIRPSMHWDACPRTLRMQEVRETDQRRNNDLKTTLFRKSMLLLTPIPDLGGKFHSTQKDKYGSEHVRSWISLNNTQVLSPFGFIIWWDGGLLQVIVWEC